MIGLKCASPVRLIISLSFIFQIRIVRGKNLTLNRGRQGCLKLWGFFFEVPPHATSYPSRGSYRKIDTIGNIETDVIIEETRMIVSFVFEDDFNEQKIKNITSILKEFGIKTNQESVAFVIDGEMYYINL